MRTSQRISKSKKGFKKFGIGIDVHKIFSIVTIYSSKNIRGIEYEYLKRDRFQMGPQGLSEMVKYLRKFSNSVIGFESTVPYSLLVYKTLVRNLFPKEKIFCVNAYFAKSLPGRKSDKIDSKNLAKYAFYGLLKSSYIPEDTYQLLRRLTRSRKRVVRMVVSAKNRIIMILDRAGLRINNDIDLFAKYGLDLLLELANGTSLKQYLNNCPPNAYILTYKANLLPYSSIELLDFEIEELKSALLEYFFLVKQVIEIERALYNFINKEGNEDLLVQFNSLISVPSIGDVSAFEILAELGQISRFNSLKSVQSYAGLVPALKETGGKEKKTRILKRGNRHLRTALTQCAKNLVRMKNINPAFRAWINKVKQKNSNINKKIWVVLGRKLLRICIALLRSGRKFDSMIIVGTERKKIEKELRSRKKRVAFFKNQIMKLNERFNISFSSLKKMVDEVANYNTASS
ncbi:MAG: IS110 family transposase [Candidatus Helarchaeota archaeon]